MVSRKETLEEKMQRLAEEAIRRQSLEVCKAAMRMAKRTREQLEEKGGETMVSSNFAEALKKARAGAGLSQQGLADQLRIPK
jgi:ribosome-binding protein aMBF1 (putative translation factor)